MVVDQVISTPLTKMRRTKKQGRTRVNRVNPIVQKGRNMARKVDRVRQRVQRLCRLPGAPFMAFITIKGNGQVSITGSQSLCDIIRGTKGEDLIKVAAPAVENAAASVPVSREIDLKGIDVVGIEWEQINILKCRRAYSRLCYSKGVGERKAYRDENKPEYWPRHIPFCSHSASRADGKGRLLTSANIRDVLQAFSLHCVEKIKQGYIPVNYVSTTNPEKLRTFAIGELDEDMADEENCYSPPTKKQKTDVVEEDNLENEETLQNSPPTSPHVLEEDPLQLAINRRDFTGVMTLLDENWPVDTPTLEMVKLMLVDVEPLQLDCEPCKPTQLKSYCGPKEFVPGKLHGSLWEVFHRLPDVTRVMVFVHGVLHLKHYVSQYEQLGTTPTELKKALRSTSNSTTLEGVLQDELRIILTCSSTGRRTTRKNKTEKARRFAQLPGADGLLFSSYGYNIWKSEVERVRRNQWLDDSIVNVMLRHAKAECDAWTMWQVKVKYMPQYFKVQTMINKQ